MSMEPENERVVELLMQRATGALSGPEAEALEQLLATLPRGEVARWERAAAELTAAMIAGEGASLEALPAGLADQIVRTGEAVVRTSPRAVAPAPVTTVSPKRPNVAAWSGWMMAAAAILFWIVSGPRKVVPAQGTRPVNVAAVLRDSLLTADSAASRLAWSATPDSAAVGASGDVVWSGRAQRGVMRIAGLQPNDRRTWQYQLWIFDASRDQKYPVDGGVFDIPPGQREVYVPIDARVPVGDAVMFAVTVERAGGVVVSTRERIALLAQRKS